MNSAGTTASDKLGAKGRADEDAYSREKEQSQLSKLKEGLKQKVEQAGSTTQEASGGARTSSTS